MERSGGCIHDSSVDQFCYAILLTVEGRRICVRCSMLAEDVSGVVR